MVENSKGERIKKQPISALLPLHEKGCTAHFWPFSSRLRVIQDMNTIPLKDAAYRKKQREVLEDLWRSGDLRRVVKDLWSSGRLVEPSAVTMALIDEDPSLFTPTFDEDDK